MLVSLPCFGADSRSPRALANGAKFTQKRKAMPSTTGQTGHYSESLTERHGCQRQNNT